MTRKLTIATIPTPISTTSSSYLLHYGRHHHQLFTATLSFSSAVILSQLPELIINTRVSPAPLSSLVAMETASFCRASRTFFPLPPMRMAVNPFAFSASSFNGKPLFSNQKYYRNLASLSGGSSRSDRTMTLWSSADSMMKITCGEVREINETEFPDIVLKSNRPVLVEFVATWCGPCRLIAPAVETLAQEYDEKLTIVKIDHDANPRLIEEYKVYGLPALILFKDGKEVPKSRREGAITKVKLKEYIDGLLASVNIP